MNAWKKQRPNNIFLKIFGIPLPSNHDLLQIGSVPYEPSRFAFNPIGGSFVILTPFCNTATGKVADGYDVSQSLNSLCGFCNGKSSHNFSSLPIQETAR